MKKFCITILIALFAWATASAQSCLPEGITFTTQGQVDSFAINYPGCTQIEGYVSIESSVNNLTLLTGLRKIGGGFTIRNTTSLTNLHGLDSLNNVGSLYLWNNLSLLNLNGLDNLDTIVNPLYIQNNNVLNDLSSLGHLKKIGSVLGITNNDSLKNLAGLENLTEIPSGLEIDGNASLENIDALYNVTNCPSININENDSLKNLSGLNQVASRVFDIIICKNNALSSLSGLNNIALVEGSVLIKYNPVLEVLDGLKSVTKITGGLHIKNNLLLEHLSGLDSLQMVNGMLLIDSNESLINLSNLSKLNSSGFMQISFNNSLSNLEGLNNLAHVPYLRVTNNSGLINLKGLYSLHEVSNDVAIQGNTSLSNLSGLDSIKTVGGYLEIIDNPSLSDITALSRLTRAGYLIINSVPVNTLSGLHNLKSLYVLEIINNPVLNDISALKNIDSISTNVQIYRNYLLNNCAIFPICNKLLNEPELIYISENGPNCDTPEEVEFACEAITVLTNVYLDNNSNCQMDSTDIPAEGMVVRLSGTVQHSLRATQSDGTAQFGYLDNGTFSLSLPQIPTENWAICQDTIYLLPDTIQTDTIHATFFLKPLNQCPQLTVDLGLPPFFRGCLVTSPMQVVTRNIGTIPAENTRVAVVMPDGLEVVSTIPSIVAQSADTLFFDLGEVVPFQASTINMVVKTTCDAVQEGKGLCIEAFATMSNPCPVITPPASEIRLFSECVSDTTVRFTIKNVGDAATQATHDYVIIEDEVILRSENFSLDPLASMDVNIPSNGATYRMEATKYDDGTLTATAIESCGGFTPGFITAYWLNDGLRNYDFDCREIRAAYDPNQKTAIPTGVGPEHLMAANKPIQYTIDFQNTGTDTAFRVQLLDILSPYLNVNTFRPGFSSHPYTWEIRGADTLEVLFYPIMLPDSNVNEATSHGWFSFEIDQKPNLPDGTTIENTASIVFDYNAPIVTNTVFHTIGKLTVSTDEPNQAKQNWQVLSNPTRYAAIFRAKEFVSGEKRFELSDAVGRVVRTEHFSGQEFEFRRGLLAGGLYYFRIIDARGKVFSGKIVVN